MNISTPQKNWTEIKGKIKTQWAKLNDNDIDALNGSLDKLTGRIQKVYGYGKDQAEREFKDFKKSLDSKMNTASGSVNPKEKMQPLDKSNPHAV